MINQIRGFLLEHGIPVRQGLRFLRQQLPEILAKRIDVLSPRMSRIIEDLSGDWRQLDERIEQLTQEIELLARGTECCRQLMTIPGIGPIIASAMIAAIGDGTAFAKGRDFAAWLGLVPKQMSTGADDPRPHQQARQSLSAHDVHAGRARYSAQTKKLSKAQLRILARGRGKTPASQCSGNCTRQQTGADRLDRIDVGRNYQARVMAEAA